MCQGTRFKASVLGRQLADHCKREHGHAGIGDQVDGSPF